MSKNESIWSALCRFLLTILASWGDGYIANDIWKEEFLLDIEKMGIPVITFAENTDYKIRGFHFYNRSKRRNEFKQDMDRLLE